MENTRIPTTIEICGEKVVRRFVRTPGVENEYYKSLNALRRLCRDCSMAGLPLVLVGRGKAGDFVEHITVAATSQDGTPSKDKDGKDIVLAPLGLDFLSLSGYNGIIVSVLLPRGTFPAIPRDDQGPVKVREVVFTLQRKWLTWVQSMLQEQWSELKAGAEGAEH